MGGDCFGGNGLRLHMPVASIDTRTSFLYLLITCKEDFALSIKNLGFLSRIQAIITFNFSIIVTIHGGEMPHDYYIFSQ